MTTETTERRPFETVKDYASKKGVTINAVYKQIEKGKLESRKIGVQIFVRPIL